jgi:hypothetical protein
MFTGGVSKLIVLQLVVTSDKMSPVLLLPAINLSPMSLLPSINYRRCHDEIDENTGQGLITGVNDTANNLLPVTMTTAIIYRWCC